MAKGKKKYPFLDEISAFESSGQCFLPWTSVLLLVMFLMYDDVMLLAQNDEEDAQKVGCGSVKTSIDKQSMPIDCYLIVTFYRQQKFVVSSKLGNEHMFSDVLSEKIAA